MTDQPPALALDAARVVVRSTNPNDPFAPGPWADLVIERRADGHAIGSVGVRVEPEEATVEVRIEVTVKARGQGYGTEALATVVRHALVERRFVRVVAVVPAGDERAQRLYERVGLRVVATDGADLVYLRRTDPSH